MLPDTEILRIFNGIKHSEYGADFLDYLKSLADENYQSFKTDSHDMNDIHKGYALAVDSLIEVFLQCDQKVEERPGADPGIHY